jgi:hypothetical protein
MPYLVRIGVIPSNVSGVGSRGYHVFRRGRTVVRRWAGVEVTNTREFYWCQERQELRERRRSEEAARATLRRHLKRLEDGDGYDRLPRGVRIRAPRSR